MSPQVQVHFQQAGQTFAVFKQRKRKGLRGKIPVTAALQKGDRLGRGVPQKEGRPAHETDLIRPVFQQKLKIVLVQMADPVGHIQHDQPVVRGRKAFGVCDGTFRLHDKGKRPFVRGNVIGPDQDIRRFAVRSGVSGQLCDQRLRADQIGAENGGAAFTAERFQNGRQG